MAGAYDGIVIAGKQEVLTPQSEGTDGVLNTVVVDWLQ